MSVDFFLTGGVKRQKQTRGLKLPFGRKNPGGRGKRQSKRQAEIPLYYVRIRDFDVLTFFPMCARPRARAYPPLSRIRTRVKFLGPFRQWDATEQGVNRGGAGQWRGRPPPRKTSKGECA